MVPVARGRVFGVIYLRKNVPEPAKKAVCRADIVGGDTNFFEKITSAITQGKAVDRMVDNSDTLSDIRDTFFNGDPDYFKSQLANWVDQFGVSSEDLKNFTISALLAKMIGITPA